MGRPPLLYKLTKFAMDAFIRFANADIRVHGEDNVPRGPNIFVTNHFTRIETFFFPYIISKMTGKEVLSLAASEFFGGNFGVFLNKLGAISTNTAERNKVMISSLLKNDMPCVIFPEGQMIKDKKLVERGKFLIYNSGIRRVPHTGAAVIFLHSEFYRQKLRHFLETDFTEGIEAYSKYFDFDTNDIEKIVEAETHIVPVNITYFPIRARRNIGNRIAEMLVSDLPARIQEEIQVEFSMIIDGVDIDINFGKPITKKSYLLDRNIKKKITDKALFLEEDSLKNLLRLKKQSIRIMHDYMDAIYRMTTVNHDHVMAYMLCRHKGKKIKESDFRNRVYLALDKLGQRAKYQHTSLGMDQDNFLMDEKNNKYANFIEAAKADDLIEIKGRDVFLNRKKFSKIYEFHNIRTDNIIEVLKNEIEPLGEVIKCLNSVSRTPSFIISKRIREKFFKKDVEIFFSDYKEYFIENESKPESIGSPFFLRRRFAGKGVLLIHGYMSAPEEMRQLAEYFYKKGYSVYGVRLRGHGTSPDDLQLRKWQEWRESVWRGEQVILNSAKKSALVGFSTGAGLALMEASREDRPFDSVIAINAPLRLSNIASRFTSSVLLWNQILKKLRIPKGRMEFVVNSPENPHINYHRNPVTGVNQLAGLMSAVEKSLKDVKIPALVIQGSEDPVVNPISGKEVFEKVGSGKKELQIIPAENHVIVRGDKGKIVFREIIVFLEKYF